MRPSVYPERIVYHDNPQVLARLKAVANERGLSFPEVQRQANRAYLDQLEPA